MLFAFLIGSYVWYGAPTMMIKTNLLDKLFSPRAIYKIQYSMKQYRNIWCVNYPNERRKHAS